MSKLTIILLALIFVGCPDNPDNNAAFVPMDNFPEPSDGGADANSSVDATDMSDATDASVEPEGAFGGEVILQKLDVQIVDGRSDQIGFEIDDDVESIAINVVGEIGETYAVGKWTNGDGSSLVNDGWLENDPGAPTLCLGCDNRITGSEGAFAGLAPNNPDVSIESGTHLIWVSGFKSNLFNPQRLQSGAVDVTITIKRKPVAPMPATLDLNLYFTGAKWTAETAQTSDEFQQILTDFTNAYAAVDLELGDVSYNDISDEFQVITSVIAPRSNVQDLFLASDPTKSGVNVFFVEEIFAVNGPGFGTILGISGGIPGPTVTGTARSGVAVAVESEGAPANVSIGNVMAHEVGHHLGLFHSSENAQAGAAIHDQLSDTAENDMNNLMYFAGSGNTISPMQARVMILNPWVVQ